MSPCCKSAGAAVRRRRFAMGPGFGFVAGVAIGLSVWATECVADRYGGMTQDLLLRYRPFEADLGLLWHVPLGFVALLLLWRLKRGFDRPERGGVVSSALLLVVLGGVWFGGAAGLEFLVAGADAGPWWDPWRPGR